MTEKKFHDAAGVKATVITDKAGAIAHIHINSGAAVLYLTHEEAKALAEAILAELAENDGPPAAA